MSEKNDETVPIAEEPYSVFTSREKWFIVSLISFGGLFRCVDPNSLQDLSHTLVQSVISQHIFPCDPDARGSI
jgi:hypothetical protein